VTRARQVLTVIASSSSVWAWLAAADTGAITAATAAHPAVRIALGPAGTGASGFRRSHFDAVAAQRLMSRRPDLRVARFADVQLVTLALQDEQRAREFVARTLGTLAGADPESRDTLCVYIGEHFSAARAAPTVPKACRGWDAAKKVNGRKRHIAVDAAGLLLEVLATPASVQDRDAARPLLFNLHRARRHVRLAWADGGYAGKLQPWAATYLKLTVQIVKRPDDLHTFAVLPRRWVVERTLAWITAYRRCARDYERLPAHHEAMVL
jgi:transposase